MTAALRFIDVSKRFGATRALDRLSFDVPKGSFFGLIGQNGAGKTTAFSLACGFLQPDGGTVEILGTPGFHPAKLRGRVLAMPQDAALGRETRCIDHLVYFAELQGMSRADARTASDRALSELGLSDRARAKTKTLSHGMLRRLAIAQALLGAPELVLLDEPTSGLDPRHAYELRELLKQVRAHGRTVVVSSHNLNEIEILCDHVAFIDRGAAVASGPTDALTGRGQEIEIELGAGPAPIAVLEAALPDDKVTWDADRRVVRVVFAGKNAREPEDVIGVALQVLLPAGARIAGVRRGATLEKKFFATTLGLVAPSTAHAQHL